MMRMILFVGSLLVGAGCASGGVDRRPPTEAERRAAEVTIAESTDQVEDCSLVGTVHVDPPFILLARAYPEMNFAVRDEVEAQLRAETARAGANAVMPTRLKNGSMYGKTYKCPDATGRAEGAEKGTG